MAAWLGLAFALSVLCAANAQSPTQSSPQTVPFGPNPGPSSSPTCASDETLNSTSMTCVCNLAMYNTTTFPPAPTLECLSDKVRLNLSKCQLEKDKYDFDNLHLLDPSCVGLRKVNGIAEMVVLISTSSMLCGNIIEVNGTHVIYSNNLTIPGKVFADGITTRNNVSYAFSCAYPLMISTSLAVHPIIYLAHVNLAEGVGSVPVLMYAFTDANYTIRYTDSSPLLFVEDPLYFMVQSPALNGSMFSVSVIRLYATAINDTNAALQHDIITNGCPSVELGDLLTIGVNGQGFEARFMLKIFKVSSSDIIYLFADVKICNGTCTQNCPIS